MKKKIYCFINSGENTDFQKVEALSEDGEFLAGHISSSEGWAKHDIGIDSPWKHDIYEKKYPKGYELIWVDNPLNHQGILKAYEKHKKLPVKKLSENQPSITLVIEDDAGKEHTITKSF